MEIWVTATNKDFREIPNTLMCGGHTIYVVVEGHLPICWACGAAGHLPKACPGKRAEPQPQNTKKVHISPNVVKGPGG